MSYVVGFGDRFPQDVQHRAASIASNQSMIVDKDWDGRDIQQWWFPRDKFQLLLHRAETLAWNSGLVAALVALSSERQSGIDKNTIFYAIPPLTCHFSSTTTSQPWILGGCLVHNFK